MSDSLAQLRRFALLALVVLAGCKGLVAPAPQSPAGHAEPGDVLQAGVARADITPPPGLSLFGHGPEGRVSVGTLLRLYCEVFVISKGTEAIALVPCDLGAISTELQRAVAQRVIGAHVPLGADRIVMMATHTHAAPAHYFGARQYGGTFSTRAPGFDPRVLDFLADRIAAAVLVAYAAKAPAKVGWAFDDEAGLGLVHNRSFTPFAANRELPPCLFARICPSCLIEDHDPVAGADTACQEPQREYLIQHQAELACPSIPASGVPGRGLVDLAADLVLSVLRIDTVLPDGGSRPLGGFAVFGVHNTGISNTNDVYHSDIFGYALRRAELLLNHRVEPTPLMGGPTPPDPTLEPRVLIGIAAGLQGDVSPSVGFQSIAETRRLGYVLGERIERAFAAAGGAMGDASLERAYRELILPGALAEEPNDFYRKSEPPLCSGLAWSADASPRRAVLCPDPEIGTAAAGGAEDGPTRLRIFPQMTEGAVAKLEPGDAPCHGRKLPVRSPNGPFGSDGLDFPSMAPLSLVRIGRGLIATAPFEMTTVTGSRIRDRLGLFLRQHQQKEIDRVVMVGLTNNYLQYAATSDEYNLQHYEGASTLYGPETARFLGNHFLCLADWLYGDHRDDACNLKQPYAVNTVHEVRSNPEEVSRMPDGNGVVGDIGAHDDLEARSTVVDLWPTWTVRFPGIPPGDAAMRDHFRVQIVDKTTGRVLDDDDGTGIEVRYDETASDKRTWMARWTPRGAYCKELVYFVIGTRPPLRSRPFPLYCRENATEVNDQPHQRSGQAQSPRQTSTAQQSSAPAGKESP